MAVSINKFPFYPSRYFEAPKPFLELNIDEPSIFLAGGITNCPDWQSYAIKLLDEKFTIFNPRRQLFDINDKSQTKKQIEWAFEFMTRAKGILFWFCESESAQPIALYELGRYTALGKPLVVGCDDHYSRREDVVHQFRLARPHRNHHVWSSLEETCNAANNWLIT